MQPIDQITNLGSLSFCLIRAVECVSSDNTRTASADSYVHWWGFTAKQAATTTHEDSAAYTVSASSLTMEVHVLLARCSPTALTVRGTLDPPSLHGLIIIITTTSNQYHRHHHHRRMINDGPTAVFVPKQNSRF